MHGLKPVAVPLWLIVFVPAQVKTALAGCNLESK